VAASARGSGMTPQPELARQLDLRPHPEGGWFRETWRSPVSFRPDGYDSPRSAATSIYYLLQPGEESRWHLVRSDELWFWHRGGPLALHLGGNGAQPADSGAVLLGGDVAGGQQPQVLIPAGTWQSAAPAAAEPVLVSCVVAPGFDFADFRLA
jgi:predicted cupin superfamily sugar epimerase